MRARTGTAQLPLHGGKAPSWLFTRMVKLSRERLVKFGEQRIREKQKAEG